ncbi:MAG: 6-phosphogluconolactonase [Chloroflexi bacterium]|nr:6-phosphogluconolactonase [Chloroflexota bacterium]
MAELHVLPTSEEAAQAKARFVTDLAKECSTNHGRFTIALSGGSTPRRLYEILASPPYSKEMAWDRWQVFWSDERCVPPGHEDSNYRMAREELLDHVAIPVENVYRMRGEDDPHEAAQAYEAVVREVFQSPAPSFDLILLGIGDDGHTASLFPGTLALGEQDRLVVDNWAPELQVHRITFTLPLINAAKVVAFLDTDETKAEMLRQVLEPAPGEAMPPAGLVRPSAGVVHWFLTTAAAGRLRATQV